MKIVVFDQPKTGNMEAQAHYTRVTRSNDKLFKELFLAKMELEKLKNDFPIYLERVENIIQSIDALFEAVIECELRCET